jgi:hypothetical protein
MVNSIKVDKSNPIEYQVWVRLYHSARYLEYNMCFLYDHATDFSDMTFVNWVGMPSVLPGMDDEISVLAYQSLSKLLTHASKEEHDIEAAGLGLMAGVLDEIPSHYIKVLEQTLVDLWDSVPEEIQLGNGPYSWMESVDDCEHPAILRFNASYYIYWMNFQSRVMQKPHLTDLQGTMLSRIDEDRALLIASMCSDALTKIYTKLSQVQLCGVEIHWATMSMDVLNQLCTSKNQPIRIRAKENLEAMAEVCKLKLIANLGVPYINLISKMISTYMDDKKICEIPTNGSCGDREDGIIT